MARNAASATTRREDTYLEMRNDIVTGRLLPGQRMQFNELSARYGSSVGVLREALSRLEAVGLVTSEPQLGFRVMPVSETDLVELTDARVVVETAVLRRAMSQGDLAWESTVVAAHHVLDNTPAVHAADPHRVREEWARAHDEFHRSMFAGCDNRRLKDIAGALRDSAELYRRWSRHIGQEDTRDIAGEHRALLHAITGHDVEEAVRLLVSHIEYSPKAILAAGVPPPSDDASPRARGTAMMSNRD